MRRTPPVVVQLLPQPAVQWMVAVIAALASGGLAAWALSHTPSAWPSLLGVQVAVVYARRAAAVPPRRLRWGGQAWWLAEPGRDEETAVQLAVLIALDAWLLLSRSQQAAQRTSLRATLFSAPRAPQ